MTRPRPRRTPDAVLSEQETADMQRGIFARTVGITPEYPLPCRIVQVGRHERSR